MNMCVRIALVSILNERHRISMRKHYVDNLRWIVIFLLVPYHAAMAWNTWGEPNYIYFESNKIISSIVVFFSPYFMPLMFLIAGGLPLPFLGELLSTGGKSFAEYTYVFLVGYYIFSNDDAVSRAEKYKWIFLCTGITATVFNVYLFVWSGTRHTLLNMAAKYVSEWFMINFLTGAGKRYLNFDGKVLKYMSKRSYSFYIFHFIWVVLFQYLLFHVCGGNIILLYALPVLCAYVATMICCEICNRIYDMPALRRFRPSVRRAGYSEGLRK